LPSCLEALPAKDWSALSRLERYGGFLATLRACGFGFRPDRPSASSASRFCTFCFASFAALRLVLEALVGEKHLLAGSKHKLGATLRTLQYLIVEFHGRLPLGPLSGSGDGSSFTIWPGVKRYLCAGQGTQIFGPAGEEPERIPNISARLGPDPGSAAPSRIAYSF